MSFFDSAAKMKTEGPARRTARAPVERADPAKIRIQKDLTEFRPAEMPQCRLEVPNPDDLFNMSVRVSPGEGYYARGSFELTIQFPSEYPFKPPKVHCRTAIFHPNIDVDGNVCLNILRKDWTPSLTLENVLQGILLLFYEPNPEDPLNREAADILRKDPAAFARQVKATMNRY